MFDLNNKRRKAMFFYKTYSQHPHAKSNTLLYGILAALLAMNCNTSFAVTPSNTANAFTDFSAVNNPNGAWSYGQTSTLGGALELYTCPANDPNGSAWRRADCAIDPNLIKNDTGSAIFGGTFFPATDYLHLHPAPDGQLSTLRYTASARGQYRIDAAFTSLRFSDCGATTDVHILRNGQLPGLFDEVINGEFVVLAPDGVTPVPPQRLTFGTTLTLQRGDTIDFAVGPNGDYFCDGTGLKASITNLGPNDKDQCKNGGWKNFGFKNQGQCIQFVNTGK